MSDSRKQFEDAGQEKPLSLVGEFLYLLNQNKKWWLLPILLVLALLALLAFLGSSGAGPFIYTLF